MNSNDPTQPEATEPKVERTPERSRGRWPLLLSIAVAVVLGGLCGILAKQADEVDVLGSSQITSMLGVWITVVAFVGYASSTLFRAAACCALGGLTAIFAYYALQGRELHYVPYNVAALWCLLCLTGVPALAAICHQLRRPGWPAAIAVGLPTSMLIAEAVPRLIAAPVIQPYVWADLALIGLITVFGLARRVRVVQLAAVVLIAAPATNHLLKTVWDWTGGLG